MSLKIGNLATHKTIMEVKTQFLHLLMEAKAGFWVVTRPNRQMYISDNKYVCIPIHSTLYTTWGILNLFWPLKWFYMKVIWRNFNSWARAFSNSNLQVINYQSDSVSYHLIQDFAIFIFTFKFSYKTKYWNLNHLVIFCQDQDFKICVNLSKSM